MRTGVFALLLGALLVVPVRATVVVPMTFEQLVDQSAAIVFGRVAGIRGQWTADRQSIDSIISLQPLRYLKGNLGTSVALRLPGGTAGNMINVIPGAPTLQEGELVVLFLKANGPALLTPLGLGQGVFRVTRDPRSGEMLVMPPALKASAAGKVIRGAAERRALTLAAFAAAVETRGAR